MPLSVEWFDDLDAAAADAGDTLDRAHQLCLYDRLDWFRLTVTHGLAGPPLVVRMRDGADAAWLFTTPVGAPLASWYTLDYHPVVLGEKGPDLLPALFAAAGRRLPRLALYPVVDGNRAAIEQALRRSGWAVLASRSSTNRYLDGRRTFDGYWAERPGPLRSTVARRSRSHPVDIAIHTRFDAQAWADYEAVYRASWKPAEGSFAFLRALAAQEGAAGSLRLGIARDAAGRPVAAQLWTVERGTATIHKLAHREDARAGSPGSLLSHALFRHAMEVDLVRRIDFGLGNEPYKTDWVDAQAPVWRIDAYRPLSLRGMAGLGRALAGRLVRRLPRG